MLMLCFQRQRQNMANSDRNVAENNNGKLKKVSEDRIVNGDPTTLSRHPWIVFIGLADTSGYDL